MTTVRDHLDRLGDADELLVVRERLHWADELPAVATEAAEVNGPAVRFATPPGHVELVSGLYGGPDRTRDPDGAPWRRLAVGLGHPSDVAYDDFLRAFELPRRGRRGREVDTARAETVDLDLNELGLPAVGRQGPPAVSMGLLVVQDEEGTRWLPTRGTVRGGHRVRAVVPAGAVDLGEERVAATLALGVPTAVLVAAIARWTGDTGVDRSADLAGALADDAVVETDRGLLPADAEVLMHGTVWAGEAPPPGPAEAWELATDSAVVKFRMERLETRSSPVVPFSPTGHPLADDRRLLGLVEAARLYHRVNGYWGTSPASWVALPAEAGLGFCLVAAEVLYAGFEWQLANALFTSSGLFDKVLLLDTTVPPMDYGRAFDDWWVKAAPGSDWQISEPDAPAPAFPIYREDGGTGARLYVEATWDPTWDEAYIAPRVTYERSYPERVRAFVAEHWAELGFEAPLAEDD